MFLGSLLAGSEVSLCFSGRKGRVFGSWTPSWASLGTVLRLSWAVWGASWTVLGPSSAVLGPPWGPLGPSCGLLGPSWADLGNFLVRLGASESRKGEKANSVQK
eukprot:6098158-Pyramimonas_sp.AAC.1